MNKGSLVKQYRAQLFDQNGSVEITANSFNHVQQTINRVLGNSSRLSEEGETNTRTILMGNEPVGWITEIEIPAHLSLQQNPYSETKQPAQKVA